MRWSWLICALCLATPALGNPDGAPGTIWVDLDMSLVIGGNVTVAEQGWPDLEADPSGHAWSAVLGAVLGDGVSMRVGVGRQLGHEDWPDMLNIDNNQTFLRAGLRFYLSQPE